MGSANSTSTSTLDIASLAWQKMTEREIPPSPKNFCIWYNYFYGGNLDLIKEIDKLLNNNDSFAPETTEFLHKLSCQSTGNQGSMAEIHQSTGKIIAGIVQELSTTSSDNKNYQQILGKYGKELEDIKTVPQLREVMNALIAGSQKMESSTTVLQERLQQATKDIEQLKTRLAETEKAAMTDSLTGIFNRNAFEHRLHEACREANNQDIALIMLDIDHFKNFNDTYGHRIGDVVLRGVAQTLSANLPAHGFAARYGGEEFSIILTGTNLEEAIKLAEELRETIAKKELRRGRDGTKLGKITISLGVAVNQPQDDGNALVERADEALYRAKKNGRNRVERA